VTTKRSATESQGAGQPGPVDAGFVVVEDYEVERGSVGIVDYLVDKDDLVLTEGAIPVGVSGLVGVLEGVAAISVPSVIGVFLP
jgi:hypothetical protein